MTTCGGIGTHNITSGAVIKNKLPPYEISIVDDVDITIIWMMWLCSYFEYVK